jgi:hypothetical protein
MQHSFDIEVAKAYGIEEAVILNNLYFWIEKNRANGLHFYDGYYWTYNSVKAFNELFPYMSAKKIKNALNHLIEEGILITGNYNKSAYDRTLWYALTQKGKCICLNGQMEMTEKENGNDQKGEPIPYINTDINTDSNTYIGAKPKAPKETKRFTPPTVDEVKAYCRERNNNIDAEYFIDYYEARNWELNKGRKVKDWKACVRTWEHNDFKRNGKKTNIETNQSFGDELTRSQDDLCRMIGFNV